MRKLTKAILILIVLIAVAIAAGFAVFAFVTRDAHLDESKLTDYGKYITVCDSDGHEMTSASLAARRKSVKLTDLNPDTVNAFIASEDRSFYRHHGLNYGRMIKALATNIMSRSFRQGASTISQQLIKNTHLTGDKTIKRKLSEIKLTKKLERRYSKDEILEMYLNTIYFGHNCYGLESAAEFYFGTTADSLTLEQSATVAGLLTSPNNYSPFKNPEKCLEKRNIVLKCMKECGHIDDIQYSKATESPLSAIQTATTDGLSCYLSCVFDELDGLEFDSYNLKDVRIITYADEELQRYADGLETEYDAAIIITDKSGGVRAYRSDINNAKRQPGSTIKPLLVYGPAIEEKLICPATKILDEKTDYGGYSPENFDKKYHGYITVTESLIKSYNIPAVKTLNALTIKKAAEYADRLGIKLEQDEKNLSLALGGMKYGMTLPEVCEKYRTFMGGGAYTRTKFIKEIKLKNGKTIYRANDKSAKVFSEGTASLINDMLCQTAEAGTGKKLGSFGFEVAAKTGTCGNDRGNTDGYCIAYTSADIVGVWLGSKDNAPTNVTGGGDCCRTAGDILRKLYERSTPASLEKKAGTATISIDRGEYTTNNKIVLADDCAPKLATCTIKVLSGAIPKEKSHKFSVPTIKTPRISVDNGTVCIVLCHTDYYAYRIKRQGKDETSIIYDGPWTNKITDTIENGTYTYSVTPYYFDGCTEHTGKTIELPPVCVTAYDRPPQEDMPDITQKDWIYE